MKFLCVECDEQMTFAERQLPGDGTLAAVFRCPSCGRMTAMLTNPMETQLVGALGVKVGGRTLPEQPMQGVRSGLAEGREDAFREGSEPPGKTTGPSRQPGAVTWSADAVARLQQVPSFVRGMVKRIYGDWAKERGIDEITPAVMDQARQELGLEGM